MIEDERGRVLVVKHRPERGGFWQGKWICPGGELEPGETIEEGIIREVREETRLEIELTRPLVPFDRVEKSGENAGLHVVYIDYLARRTGGKLQPASDVGEARWIAKESIGEIWEEFHEDTRRLFEIAGLVKGQ